MRKLLDFLFGWLQPFKGLDFSEHDDDAVRRSMRIRTDMLKDFPPIPENNLFWEHPYYLEPGEIEARITELQIRAQTARRNKKKHSHFIEEIKALRTKQLRAEAAR